jgi:small neutral amino acid transporter SnatA (MarC family)
MLDSIPRRVWAEYWWRARWPSIAKWGFLVLLAIPFALYYPIMQYLTRQEVRQTITVSNMTVFYILFLFYMAHFANKLLTRFTANKPYIYRLAGLFLFILALAFFLDAIGMKMRW